MKRQLYVFISVGVFLAFGFTPPRTNVSERVLNVFNNTFEGVQNVQWVEVANEYVAVFRQNDIRTIITYNENGKFVSCRRYYMQENLPLNILMKIKERYNGKTIGLVTELLEGTNLVYSINVEDDDNVYVVETKGRNLSMRLKMKFQKQQIPAI